MSVLPVCHKSLQSAYRHRFALYGVTIDTNVVVGRTIEVDELFEQGYEAIFIGSGAGLPRFIAPIMAHLCPFLAGTAGAAVE